MQLKELENIQNINSLEKVFNENLKRILDIVISILVLLLSSPFMILISVLIKLSSKGNIIYVQERITKDNKVFNMYKFRTMLLDAEKVTGPVLAENNDPRCTKIGLILRRLSLDELPQFINVLQGDMSIVGPRPERPFYVNILKDEISNYSLRHRVKTGITGLAQIKGLRGKTSIELRIKYDLDYINNWSILLDLKIILKTFFVVLRDFFSKKAC